MLASAGPGVDAFSYHQYGAISRRCAGMGLLQTSLDDALSEEWLARTDETLSFNNGRKASRFLTIPVASEGYSLASTEVRGGRALLNGTELKLQRDGTLPDLIAVRAPAGVLTFAPATITFVALPAAGNDVSR